MGPAVASAAGTGRHNKPPPMGISHRRCCGFRRLCVEDVFVQPGKGFLYTYYIIACGVILLGAGLNAGLLWNIADLTMGAMTLINMPVILLMSKYAVRCLNDYTRQRKEGKEPKFRAKDIDLPHKVDCWE